MEQILHGNIWPHNFCCYLYPTTQEWYDQWIKHNNGKAHLASQLSVSVTWMNTPQDERLKGSTPWWDLSWRPWMILCINGIHASDFSSIFKCMEQRKEESLKTPYGKIMPNHMRCFNKGQSRREQLFYLLTFNATFLIMPRPGEKGAACNKIHWTEFVGTGCLIRTGGSDALLNDLAQLLALMAVALQ